MKTSHNLYVCRISATMFLWEENENIVRRRTVHFQALEDFLLDTGRKEGIGSVMYSLRHQRLVWVHNLFKEDQLVALKDICNDCKLGRLEHL